MCFNLIGLHTALNHPHILHLILALYKKSWPSIECAPVSFPFPVSTKDSRNTLLHFIYSTTKHQTAVLTQYYSNKIRDLFFLNSHFELFLSDSSWPKQKSPIEFLQETAGVIFPLDLALLDELELGMTGNVGVN